MTNLIFFSLLLFLVPSINLLGERGALKKLSKQNCYNEIFVCMFNEEISFNATVRCKGKVNKGLKNIQTDFRRLK